jgi:hypothetical protein
MGEGTVTSTRNYAAKKPGLPPEDRHYRNQVGIGDRGAFARFLAGRREDETTAEEYLKTTKKPYKRKSVIAEGLKEHLTTE